MFAEGEQSLNGSRIPFLLLIVDLFSYLALLGVRI